MAALKNIFQIGEADKSVKHHLLLETGADHFRYALLHNDRPRISEIGYFDTSIFSLQDDLVKGISTLREKNFEGVTIGVFFPTALLLPQVYASKGEELVRTVYAEPSEAYLAESVLNWQVHTSYCLPDGLYTTLINEFPSAKFRHSYTCTLMHSADSAEEGSIRLHFTSTQFQVIVKKGALLQLAQIYNYKTPLDVVYYLLKITSELEMRADGVELFLSGLIDADSPMYKELFQYFRNPRFSGTAIDLPQSDYPEHYFQSTANLARCVL